MPGKARPREQAASSPVWLAFLDRVFAGDQSLVAVARRMLGYSLTGSIRDHALSFLYGTGGTRPILLCCAAPAP